LLDACLEELANRLPQVSTEQLPAIQWIVMVSIFLVRLPEWFGLSLV